MRLVEFKKSEASLFEALSVIHFGADQPGPKEVKTSIKAEEEFEKYPETKESDFKLSGCPFCRQRVSQAPRIHTLRPNEGADLILDDKVFDYINGSFDRWQVIGDPKLKRPFVELQTRFAAATSRKGFDDKPLDTYDSIKKYITDRDAKEVSGS